MIVQYPVRCECGAYAVGTLVADPSVPLYSCGSWGGRLCRFAERPPATDPNVERPTLAELAAIRSMLGLVAGPVAVTWSDDDGPESEAVDDCDHPWKAYCADCQVPDGGA